MPIAAKEVFLRRLGLLCLAALLLLVITAAVQRQRELSSVERECIARIRPFAENGYGDAWDYLYPWQGYSIYLIENRRRSPQLLRLLLLSEARRVHPESYMNRYSINYDLRVNLMHSVLPKYADDAMVHWAAGVCHMNAAEFSEAQHELQKALELGLSFDNTGIHKEDVLIRIMLAAAMDGDPAETLHWVRDTQLGTGSGIPEDNSALNVMFTFADMLCRLGMYAESIEYSEPLVYFEDRKVNEQYGNYDRRLISSIYLRALWWSGDRDSYIIEWERVRSELFSLGIRSSMVFYLGYWQLNALGRSELLYGNLTESRQFAEETREMETRFFSLLGEGWGLFDNEECRDELSSILASGKQRLADGAHGMPNELSWEELNSLQTRTGRAFAQFIRAEILRHDWAAAQKLLDDNADNYFWPTPTPISTAEFLLGIVNGEDIPALTEKLRACIIVAPFLFHSPEYAAACEAGKRDPQRLQSELVHTLASPSDPEENFWSGASNYSDWSNGTLDW